jgi:hypothetical protein
VYAKSALFHYSSWTHGNIRVEGSLHFFWKFRGVPVKMAHRIRTGLRTEATADATVIVYQYQALIILECCTNRTDFDARRIVAVLAGPRNVRESNVGVFSLDQA